MRLVQAIVIALTIAASGAAEARAPADSRAEPPDVCARGRDPALRLKACTEVIRGAQYSREQKAAALRGRGQVRAAAGANEQAVTDLTESLRLDPGNGATFQTRAEARLARGDRDGAIADFGEAIRLAKSPAATVPALVGRGHARLVAGQVELAIADFTEAARINPKHAAAFNNRGLALRRKGDLDGAIADYTTAITLNPAYALAHANRGYAHEVKGSRIEAIADFTRALALDASLVGASRALARLKADHAGGRETGDLIKAGKALAEAHCSRCHAIGPAGASPLEKAPEFRIMQERHPILALRTPLTRGIAAPHDEMPSFQLTNAEIDKIIAYINSLPAPRRTR